MSIDARAAFSRATELHRQGKLDEAIDIYRRLSKAQPAFEVQRLLVFALLQARRFKDALQAARRTRDAFPSQADAHVLLGAALQASRAFDKALAAYDAAAALNPALGEAHYLAGNALVALGRHGDAVVRFDRVLELDSRAAEALANRAAALSRLGRSAEALRDCETLTAMQPWEPRHWLSKAGTLLELGRFDEVTQAAEVALRLAPRMAEAHFMRAQGRQGLADYEGAEQSFRSAIAAAPEQVAWNAHVSRMLLLQGRVEEALAVCDAALAQDPDCAPLLDERAEVRRAHGDLEAALQDAESAVALAPQLARAHINAAALRADLGDAEGSAAAVSGALSADSDSLFARYLRGREHLADGRWPEGWEDYESRSELAPPAYQPLPFQRWDGREAVEELIVLGEQGIGDHIFFGRLLRLVADRGIHARLLVAPRHAPLMGRIDARVPVIHSLDAVDQDRPGLRWVPLASLPRLIAPNPASWPRAPYLTADPERIARWRSWRLAEPPHASSDEELPPDEPGPDLPQDMDVAVEPEPVPEPAPPLLRIGICWQGNPATEVDVGRSIPLAAFAPLADLERVELVSLQWGVGEEQLDTVAFGGRIVRLAADRDAEGTFIDTAGILQHLDLVVTSDTSVAHLAGARGRPAFLALRAVPEWRWGRSGETTALYPSLRLFRQRNAGDWDEVFERITAAVAELLRGRQVP